MFSLPSSYDDKQHGGVKYLHQIISGYTEDEMHFQQWQSIDRTIVNMVMKKFEFIEFLVKKIDLLTAHSYITKLQAKYLSGLKENLSSSTCMVLADFAENYSMAVQDAVQGWHWTKQQCTIHPLVIYYKNVQEKLAVQSMVYFSNDLEHDTGFVYQLQKLFSITFDFIPWH